MLQKEHSKAQTDRIVRYIGEDKDRFAVLMKLFLGSEWRITQRAAWSLCICVRACPALLNPYFKDILDNLEKDGHPVAVVRNTVRMLQDVTIPKKYQGRVMNLCFGYVEAPETPIAVKAFSLTILQNLSRDYPEILPELKLLIEDQWEHGTPGFRSRAKRVLKAMEK